MLQFLRCVRAVEKRVSYPADAARSIYEPFFLPALCPSHTARPHLAFPLCVLLLRPCDGKSSRECLQRETSFFEPNNAPCPSPSSDSLGSSLSGPFSPNASPSPTNVFLISSSPGRTCRVRSDSSIDTPHAAPLPLPPSRPDGHWTLLLVLRIPFICPLCADIFSFG